MSDSHVFETSLVVRGHECGTDAVIPLSMVLSYLEHCRWDWIRDPDLGLLPHLRQGHFFVVHRATLALARTFGIGTALTVRAALRDTGRVTCEVEQDLVRDDGVLLAKAQLTAIWMGPTGRMARVPQSARDVTTDAPLSSTGAPPEPGEPGSFLHPPEHVYEPVLERLVERDVPEHADRAPLVVRDSDCDLFQHVNNAQYLRYFEDALGAKPARADVEYRGQAVPGDVLSLRSWDAGDGRTAFALQRDDAVLCRAVLSPRPTGG